MKTFFLFLVGFLSFLCKADCPKIDKSVLDVDGMPFCPGIVETVSAYSVYSCAIDQARSFHVPTDAEKKLSATLLNAWKANRDGGIKAANTAVLLKAADDLGLQACRVKKVVAAAVDSYLLVYTKPGIQDYSGAFWMLRETKASKVWLIGPHDDSDGTYASTKKGVSETSALALVSNGHKRHGDRTTDFVHSTNNLGTVQVALFGKMFPGGVVLHIHGMANNQNVLYRSRNDVLGKVYEDAIKKFTKIEKFAPLNADFTVDPLVNTNWYVKTEIPAQIHENNKMVVANVVREIETHGFAWPDVKAVPELDVPVYKYAVRPKPVQGVKTLTCLGIKYQDMERTTSVAECKNLANQIDNFYRTNSRGLLKMKTAAFNVPVPLNGNPANVYAAEAFAVKQHPGFDLYAVVGYFYGTPHAGKGIAHLDGLLNRDGQHEVGHLLGLGHAGVYKKDGDKWTLDAYGDGKSVMGKFASAFLTAPQYYHQGWLNENEAVMYEPGKTYELRRVTDFAVKGIATVIVPADLFKSEGHLAEVAPDDDVAEDPGMVAYAKKPKPRNAFISFPPGCDGSCFAIHLSSDGGSQKIVTHGSEYWDDHFTGLHVKIVDFVGGRVKVTIDFEPKPVGK